MLLDYVLLGLLTLKRVSGYDVSRWMNGSGRYIGYGVKSPQIYRKLGQLVERGWAAFDVDPREGAPDAKVYRITEAGREALLEWARSRYEPSTRPGDPDFTIRFVFAGQLDPEIALDIVNTELEFRIKHDGTNPQPDFGYGYDPQIPELDAAWAGEVHLMAHEHGYAYAHSYITWLQLTKARLERKLGRWSGH